MTNVLWFLAGWVVTSLLVGALWAYVKRNDPPN